MERLHPAVRSIIDELRARKHEEAIAVAELLEAMAAQGGEKARPDYLVLSLQELRGWAEYAIAKLQRVS